MSVRSSGKYLVKIIFIRHEDTKTRRIAMKRYFVPSWQNEQIIVCDYLFASQVGMSIAFMFA